MFKMNAVPHLAYRNAAHIPLLLWLVRLTPSVTRLNVNYLHLVGGHTGNTELPCNTCDRCLVSNSPPAAVHTVWWAAEERKPERSSSTALNEFFATQQLTDTIALSVDSLCLRRDVLLMQRELTPAELKGRSCC